MTLSREQIEADILQQIRNAVQETLLLHAPDNWPDEQLDDIERRVLDGAQTLAGISPPSELLDKEAQEEHIHRAIAETKQMIIDCEPYKTLAWVGVIHPDWSPPEDLITVLIRLPIELNDDVELAVRKHPDWFASKEDFVATAVSYVIQCLDENPPFRPCP